MTMLLIDGLQYVCGSAFLASYIQLHAHMYIPCSSTQYMITLYHIVGNFPGAIFSWKFNKLANLW